MYAHVISVASPELSFELRPGGQFDSRVTLWIALANEPRCSRTRIVTTKVGGDIGNLGLIAKRGQEICRAAWWRPGNPLRHVVEMFSR
jgi:hypothetical protein